MTVKKTKLKDTFQIIIAALLLCTLLVLELFKDSIFVSPEYGEVLYILLTRTLGGLACTFLVVRAGMAFMLVPFTTLKKFLLVLPCMAVAINNFPFIPFFSGEVKLGGEPMQIALYALSCLAVGFFEEMAFRGCIFTSILQRIGKRRAGIFWSIVASSAVFGVIHLLNLFVGASPISVLLQVGYSFLIGAMCSIVLVRTQNIWYCVLIHGVYNFAGGIVPEFGEGIIWSLPEIILTVAVAVPVAVYVIYLIMTTKYGAEDNNADIQ